MQVYLDYVLFMQESVLALSLPGSSTDLLTRPRLMSNANRKARAAGETTISARDIRKSTMVGRPSAVQAAQLISGPDYLAEVQGLTRELRAARMPQQSMVK